MAKRIPAVTQAFSDLLNVTTELKLAEAYGDIKAERATLLALKVEAATDTLQRAINRAKRVLEEGVGDAEDE